jgi:uncharacterized Zn-binding protein involved in type VI secretion
MPPAARLTDMHICPMITGVVPHVGGPILPPCCPTVLIGMLPAARVTDMATCVGPPDMIAMGSPTVLIANLMAARIGDPTIHGGVIIVGEPTVIIGEVGMGGIGSPFAMAMSAAKTTGAANAPTAAAANAATRGVSNTLNPVPANVRAKVPSGWTEVPSKHGGGTQFINPKAPNQRVRYQPGNPKSPFPNSRQPYVKVTDKDGNTLMPDGSKTPAFTGPATGKSYPIGNKYHSDAHQPADTFKGNLGGD